MNVTTSLECQESLQPCIARTGSYDLLQHFSLPLLLAYLFAKILGSNHALLHGILNAGVSLTRRPSSFASVSSPWIWQYSICLGLPILYLRVRQSKQRNQDKKHHETDQFAQPSHEDSNCAEHGASFLEPLLFSSQTTHRRLFPTTHSFSYSYLLVGVPVSTGSAHYGSTLSSHTSSIALPAWFSVHSLDYLLRGTSFSQQSLRQKLDMYFTEQGIKPSVYPHAYLVTAPRFLGFSFNPVSFWYLYTADRHLAAMILEVNNTFDERRLYFLQPDPVAADGEKKGGIFKPGEQGRRFRFEWQKDFHVSPFNDRDGSYSVSAVDIAATGTVDVTIVLREARSSNECEKAKVVARVWSTTSALSSTQGIVSKTKGNDSVGRGIDPVTLTISQRVKFLLRYAWIGFLTNPRILREAQTLWVKKLKVFYRPEPFRSTIGRNETEEELVLERCFCSFLHKCAIEAQLAVRYMPAAGKDRGMFIELGHGASVQYTDTRLDREGARLEVQVLTPSFYAEIVRTDGNLLEAFERLCFQSKQGEAMVWVSEVESMRKLLKCTPSTRVVTRLLAEVQPTMVVITKISVGLLRSIGRSGLGGTIWSYWEDPRSAQDQSRSEFDNWVIQHGLEAEFGETGLYLRAVLVVLLADRLSFGSTRLFRLGLRALRVLCVFLATGSAL